MVTYQLIPADLYDGYKAVVGVGVFFYKISDNHYKNSLVSCC